MHERLTSIRSWCAQRGINQMITFFKGCSNDRAMYDASYARIGAVLRGRTAQVTDIDEPWITDMEQTINKLSK